MVDVTPTIPAGRQVIESYGGGRFRVSGVLYAGSIMVFAERTLAWPVADMAAVAEATLAPLTAPGNSVDLLLLGCGARPAPIPPELRQTLRRAGIVVETMGTGAACRTYNVLLAEGRHVAAALIAID
ncbi:MAG: hypothetical protein EXQ87_10255 [Alphaproteobacteria bacterium]|nr:hypothetical protein [Alphaproteobacteria bacterium]